MRQDTTGGTPSPPSAPAHDLEWLDLVEAPLLVVRRATMVVVAANGVAQRLFGPVRLGPLPRAVEGFAGDVGRAALAAAIDAGTPAVATCQLVNNVRPFGFTAKALPTSPGDWVVTLAEVPPPPDGDWRSKLEDILNSLPVCVEIYDNDLNALFYNRRADDLFLYDAKAVIHHDDWFELGYPDPGERQAHIDEWRSRLDAARRSPETIQQTEWRMRCRDGTDRIVQFLFRFVGEHFVMVLWDVTEQRALEAELSRLARTDQLSGIANRRGFLERAETAFAQALATGTPLSVLILDIDHFKTINDRHGHAGGDAVIRAIGAHCRREARSGDLVGRIGGEEFAQLLPDTGPSDAAALAERLVGEIAATPVAVDGEAISVRISIGATSRVATDTTLATLLGRADLALYEAKDAGRDRVVFKGPD